MLHSYVERVWSFVYVFSWEFIHYWSGYAQKKKKCIVHYIVFHWAHVWMCWFALLSLCFRESSYESFFLRFYLGIFWVRVWVAHSFLWERRATFSLVSLDLYSIHHSIYFGCDYFSCFDVGWPSLIFLSLRLLLSLFFILSFFFFFFFYAYSDQ